MRESVTRPSAEIFVGNKFPTNTEARKQTKNFFVKKVIVFFVKAKAVLQAFQMSGRRKDAHPYEVESAFFKTQ